MNAPVSKEQTAPRLWTLRSCCLFEDFSESLMDWADREARETEFRRGDVVRVVEDEKRSILAIVDGQVKLRTFTEGGKESILDVAGPGDVVGPVERLFSETSEGAAGSLATEAVGLSDGLALRFAFDEFEEMVSQRPVVVLSLTRLIGMKQMRFQVRLSRLLYRSSLGKVAGLLTELAERYGEGSPPVINFRLTHQELASMIGVKRETVSECLATLELDELIRADRRKIVILDPVRLSEVP